MAYEGKQIIHCRQLISHIDISDDSENKTQAEKSEYNKHRERQSVLPVVLKQIAKQYHITKIQAIESFYSSKTGEYFAQDNTEYYQKTADELLKCYQNEKA